MASSGRPAAKRRTAAKSRENSENRGFLLRLIFDKIGGRRRGLGPGEKGKRERKKGRGLPRAPTVSPFLIFGEHGSKKIGKTRKKEGGRREEAGFWDPLEGGEKEIYRESLESLLPKVPLFPDSIGEGKEAFFFFLWVIADSRPNLGRGVTP